MERARLRLSAWISVCVCVCVCVGGNSCSGLRSAAVTTVARLTPEDRPRPLVANRSTERDIVNKRNRSFLPARRYASAGTSYGPVSICLCLSQVGVLSKRLTNRAGFWHDSFLTPILHVFLLHTLDLDRHQSTKFTISPSSDARPL